MIPGFHVSVLQRDSSGRFYVGKTDHLDARKGMAQ
jgi:hypothetical protein